MSSLMRVAYASRSSDSYGRTDGRTNEESWLSRGNHLTFRNARAHIPDSSPLPRSSESTRRLAIARARAERSAS